MAVLPVKVTYRAELIEGLKVLTRAGGAVSVHYFQDGWVVQSLLDQDRDRQVKASKTLELALESCIRRNTTFFEDNKK